MTASIFRAKYLSLLTNDSFGSHALKVVIAAALASFFLVVTDSVDGLKWG
jgi:hypothetical protein